jgi:DhnA family fructose-bisphosphate aldolase class Ia
MSSSTGKLIRLKRLIETETNTCLIVAIDHGMTSPRFLPGLVDTGLRVGQAISGGANVLMLGRGMARAHAQHFRRETSLALMLTASAAGRPSGATITPIGSVEEALRIGADAVVVASPWPATMNRAITLCRAPVRRASSKACPDRGCRDPNAYQNLDSMSESSPGVLKRNARLCAS